MVSTAQTSVGGSISSGTQPRIGTSNSLHDEALQQIHTRGVAPPLVTSTNHKATESDPDDQDEQRKADKAVDIIQVLTSDRGSHQPATRRRNSSHWWKRHRADHPRSVVDHRLRTPGHQRDGTMTSMTSPKLFCRTELRTQQGGARTVGRACGQPTSSSDAAARTSKATCLKSLPRADTWRPNAAQVRRTGNQSPWRHCGHSARGGRTHRNPCWRPSQKRPPTGTETAMPTLGLPGTSPS